MTDHQEPHDISVYLNGDEAIVLFELVSRWNADGQISPSAECFIHPSEIAVLQTVLASLESQLTTPFREDYKLIIAQARARVFNL